MSTKLNLKQLLVASTLLATSVLSAQEAETVNPIDAHEQRITTVEDGLLQLKKLKITGYVQAQWQSSQLDSMKNKTNDMKSGTAAYGNEKTVNGDYNRFGVRRGRLKATYEDFGCQGVVEFNIDESGLRTKTLYVNVLDPWLNTFSVRGGVFDNPFGYEVVYSSSKLESPERARIIQAFFPDENVLGAMLTVQAPKTSVLNPFKLEAALVAGNAIAKDYKGKKDFVGHLTYSKSSSTLKYGLGLSMYSGSVLQTNENVYSMKNGAFVLNGAASNKYGSAARQYYGADAQCSVVTPVGLTHLRGEYLIGNQPGTLASTAAPKEYDPTTAAAADTYKRSFQGGYLTLVQDILDTKHSVVLKYDWYDPNTDVKGSQVGIANKTGKADMAYSTIGLGYFYRMNNNVRLSAYYDIVSNEKTKVTGYFNDAHDNLWTVRMQYKF